MVVSFGLIAWRGDRLRAPGVIDSPLSREGAFLANNVVFTLFAFVVLLGTVFPLFVEALDNREIKVGAPFFDRLGVPIGHRAAVPHGRSPRCCRGARPRHELLRDRLFWPAWCGVGAVAVSVAAGAEGFAPLVAFGLGRVRRRRGRAPAGAGRPAARACGASSVGPTAA